MADKDKTATQDKEAPAKVTGNDAKLPQPAQPNPNQPDVKPVTTGSTTAPGLIGDPGTRAPMEPRNDGPVSGTPNQQLADQSGAADAVISIDSRPYTSPRYTTGIALYQLAAINGKTPRAMQNGAGQRIEETDAPIGVAPGEVFTTAR